MKKVLILGRANLAAIAAIRLNSVGITKKSMEKFADSARECTLAIGKLREAISVDGEDLPQKQKHRKKRNFHN
jgi:hypothetical protein